VALPDVTLQVTEWPGEGDPVLVMHCIEYPRRPAELLEQAIKTKEQGTRFKEQGIS